MSMLGDSHWDSISVVVADDHPMYRQGVVQVLTSGQEFSVVGESDDGSDAICLIRDHRPDIALVDLRLPSRDGIAVAEWVSGEQLLTRVIIVSAFEDASTMFQAFDAGARGYVTKLASPATLCEAIRIVFRGELIFPENVMPQMTERHRLERARTASTGALTSRELEVLNLIAQGRSAPEIAEDLFLGVTTVRTHIQHIFDKLGAADRAGAVAAAARRGLIH